MMAMSSDGSDATAQELIPLLLPDVPSLQDIFPWLERVHAARHFSNFGPLVSELERIFATQFAVESKQVSTVANATLGLELVLQSLDLPPKSRILVPSFTFVATVTAVLRAGHIPVLADVDDSNWMLTPEIARFAHAYMPVAAILPVATFGMPQDMQAWQQFEVETNVPVVIDAAAGYGSQWLDGAHGTLVFSLHTTKSLPAVEGGIVVSSRPGLAAKVRELSNFGINLNSAAGLPVGMLASTGTNAKMSEYHAAVCLAALQDWEHKAAMRRSLQAELIRKLDFVSEGTLRWQAISSGGGLQAPMLLCPRLPSEECRQRLEKICSQQNISFRRWYQPLLADMPVLNGRCHVLDIPVARALSRELLGLPFFLGMQDAQKDRLFQAISSSLKRKERLKEFRYLT
ncbi:DegT/DnrJ/EryC1/StrS family aminotransferase [Comamonas terrigena]|uniref:DegT/DnrJ/EryC1/StrS family aminotransferase n=1 Tax=Comamonas terrigena TaxID=32013 RepID=UPI0028A215EE|nr:DegT/DnrJ/EryC1/StrS family aminotransferase [Comamonas terrigena]